MTLCVFYEVSVSLKGIWGQSVNAIGRLSKHRRTYRLSLPLLLRKAGRVVALDAGAIGRAAAEEV